MTEPRLSDDRQDGPITARQVYNVVSDVGLGANVRFKDNLYQGIAVLFCALVGVITGYLLGSGTLLGEWLAAGLGAVAGLLLGVLVSGIFLMVYRSIRHIQGKHD